MCVSVYVFNGVCIWDIVVFLYYTSIAALCCHVHIKLVFLIIADTRHLAIHIAKVLNYMSLSKSLLDPHAGCIEIIISA